DERVAVPGVAEREPGHELAEPRLMTYDGGGLVALRDQREELGPGSVGEQVGHDRTIGRDRREELGGLRRARPRAGQDPREPDLERAQPADRATELGLAGLGEH